MSAPAWNDETFLAYLEQGLAEEARLALAFLGAGLAAQWVRPGYVADRDRVKRGELADEPDLLVIVRHRVEVKFRELSFTGPADYPYSTAFVGRRSRWDGRSNLPLAVVLVSRPTGAVVVVPGSSRSSWVVETAPDRVTRRVETSYACPRELLEPLDSLVEWPRRHDTPYTNGGPPQ